MSTTTRSRTHGLVTLLTDALVHGTSAVERVHLETAARPFAVLDAIPVVRGPARVVEVAHGAITASVYATIRLAMRAAGSAAAYAVESAHASDER